MIGQKVVPSRSGGVEIVVENLSTRLSRQGHEVTLFNRYRRENRKTKEFNGCKIKNIFTINTKSLDAIIYSFFATVKAGWMAARGEFDVLHFHAEGPCFFLPLLPKRKRRKYKIVVTVHGLDWQRRKWGKFASYILRMGEKRAVRYADEIIVLSRNNERYFREKYNRETVFIPNGVETPCPYEAKIIKEKYGLDRDDYLLYLARIVPEKGAHYLIEAWKKVRSQIDTDKKLVIAGGESHSLEYYNEIRNMAAGDNSILMTGFVEGRELSELYSNAYLYVLPSDVEGMPLTLLEAMSYGNVCLVSDIAENVELIYKDCFVFKHGDTDDLCEKLKTIIDGKLETHCMAHMPYTWQDVTEKHLKIYLR